MWTSYSTRQAAELIGLTESAVRSLVREGLLAASDQVPVRLSFRDLAGLRAVKGLLDGGVPLARLRRELAEIRRRTAAPVAELPLEVRNGHVHLRGEDRTGDQLELAITPPPGATPSEIRELQIKRDAPVVEPVPALTADDWFEWALALEDSDPQAALECYHRSVKLRPDCAEAWINAGRIHAESGDAEGAMSCFDVALKIDPADATALYNLGVLAQDAGREQDAIALYDRALALDPTIAEAHYNLATLFDQSGDARAAIRHINEYRKLTK